MKALRIAALAVVFTAAASYVAAPLARAQSQDIKEADELFERGDAKSLKKAAKKYDTAIRKDPKGVAAGVYGKRAAIYYLQRRYQEGLDWIDNSALKQYPGAPEILAQKALMLWSLNKRGDAIEIADKVASQKKDAFQVQLLRGNYYAGRDPAKAAEAFDAYLKYRPSGLAEQDALPRLKLGLAYLKIDQAKDAKFQFEAVAKQFRKNPRWVLNANNGLCAAYTRTQEFDRAITLCERIIEDPRNIDRTGAVWYNLGQSYLQKKQPRKARQAGLEFVKVQKAKAKGFMLVGDAYYLERDYDNALRFYKDAESRTSASDTQLLKKMGQTYRKLGQAQLAVEKLEPAFQNNPDDVELGVELGETYLDDKIKDDTKAVGAVSKLMEKHTDNAALRYVAARGLYNTGKYAQAKVRFMEAHKLSPNETKYRDGLVNTINLQAAVAHSSGDLSKATKYLEEAYDYHKRSPITNLNLAVVNIESGKCEAAMKYLGTLRKGRRESRVIADRLIARAYMCQKKPDPQRALKKYAAAAKGAGSNNMLKAEIFAEWGAILATSDLDDAIDKLEFAHQVASVDPLRGPAIRRNLALALYRRGWKYMAKHDGDKALEDFEKATRDKSVLQGTELPAFDFSLALAYLDTGKPKEALKIFDSLGKVGKTGSYLQSPYDKVGTDFFSAYAQYRSNDVKSRRDAAREFTKLQKGAKGKFATTISDLIGSSWQFVAAAEYRSGKSGPARSALKSAQRYANSKAARNILTHNNEVLSMGKGSISAFQKMGKSPPEALVNLGIAYDRAGQPRQAYDAWVSARSAGVRNKTLEEWIDAKQRIFGYK